MNNCVQTLRDFAKGQKTNNSETPKLYIYIYERQAIRLLLKYGRTSTSNSSSPAARFRQLTSPTFTFLSPYKYAPRLFRVRENHDLPTPPFIPLPPDSTSP